MALTAAEAIQRAYKANGGSFGITDWEYTCGLVASLVAQGTDDRPYYAAARLRRWSQILDAAAKLMEEQA